MKSLFKNSKILSVILAITVLLSQASLVSVYAQEANNAKETLAEHQLKQFETLEENEWKPYSDENQFEDVFVIDPSDLRIIEPSQIELNEVEEILAQSSARCGVDQYGYTGWTSLAAAKAYYGTGFSYFSIIPFIFSGGRYTHYYTFSDGSRMYFGVNP